MGSSQWRHVCPNCGSTSWRRRTKTRPAYRCSWCSEEFEELFDKKRGATVAPADTTRTPASEVRLDECTPAAQLAFDIICEEYPISVSAIDEAYPAPSGVNAKALRQLRELGLVLRTQSAADERKRLYRPVESPGSEGR